MAVSRILKSGNSVAGGGSVTYTVAAGTSVHATDIFVVNNGASDTTFTIQVTPLAGLSSNLYKAVPIKASSTRVLAPVHLSSEDTFVLTSTGDVDMLIFGESFG